MKKRSLHFWYTKLTKLMHSILFGDNELPMPITLTEEWQRNGFILLTTYLCVTPHEHSLPLSMTAAGEIVV